MDRDRVIYQVPPYRGYAFPRPVPVHPQRIGPPFLKDPSKVHLDFMFPQDLPHHVRTSRDDRMYWQPSYPNPYLDGGIFYLHNMWNRPLFRHSYSQGQRGRPQNSAPIVDFPDMANPREEERWDENVGIEEIDPERLKEITSDDDEDLDNLESVSAVGENRQVEAAPESEYVALETIRKVKEQAREQAMRMKDHQSSETIEMAEMNDPTQGSNDHYDRPRRRDFHRNDHKKPQRVVHNPTTTQKGSKHRFVGVSNRGWTPGGSGIPDGIVAGAPSNVSGERFVSIPDTTHYATISESSDVQSSNEAPEPPDRPQDRHSGESWNQSRSNKKEKYRRYTSSAEPISERRKEHDDATICKRWICVFILVSMLLVCLTLVGVILIFVFIPGLEDCREDGECIRRFVIITAVVVAGCVILCLLFSCCFWCLFVTYSHVINRRRAYPIHHRPSTGSMH